MNNNSIDYKIICLFYSVNYFNNNQFKYIQTRFPIHRDILEVFFNHDN